MKVAAALVAGVLASGCAHLSDPRFDYDLLYQDENTCAANPKHLPGCIAGLVLYLKLKVD